MARGNDNGLASLIAVAIVLAPFIWLYNAIGAFWFWLIVIGIPVLAGVGWFLQGIEKGKTGTQVPMLNTTGNAVLSGDEFDTDSAWIRHCEQIEEAWERGNYDWARQQLQQIAYSMVGDSVTQQEKDKFTQVMKDFASEDPLYRQVMERLLPMVETNPGIVQSQIYKGQPDEIKEQMRYVLYFAHELGHIHRVKKGNSYSLYPPDMADDVADEIEKKVAKKRMTNEDHYKLRKIDSDAQRNRIMEAADTFPYLMLDVVDFNKAKLECCAMDGKAMRYDDPFWESHFPPCNKTCLCRVIQYSESMLKARGIPIIDRS